MNEAIQIIGIELPTEEVGIAFGAKLLDFLDFAVSHAELGRVVLGYKEHFIVLFPVCAEVGIAHNDEIDGVESGEHAAEVIKDLEVDVVLFE